MSKLYRNAHDFAIVIGSLCVRPGDTIELVGYNGSMLEPVANEGAAVERAPVEAEESVVEEAATEEKPKRARKTAAEPEAE